MFLLSWSNWDHTTSSGINKAFLIQILWPIMLLLLLCDIYTYTIMDANIKHSQNMCKLLPWARTSVLGFIFYLWLRVMSLSTNTLNTQSPQAHGLGLKAHKVHPSLLIKPYVLEVEPIWRKFGGGGLKGEGANTVFVRQRNIKWGAAPRISNIKLLYD